MSVARAAALLPLLLAAAPARAEEDAQVWGAASANLAVGGDWVGYMDVQVRTSNDASRLNQVLLRPAIGYKLSPTTTIFLGYAHAFTNPPGPAQSNENRIWQQASYRVFGDGKGVTLAGRSRLEQRLVDTGEDTGVRARQQLRLTAPLNQRGLQGVGWSELFVALNDTDWGQRGGLDRMRAFAGISAPLSDQLRLEPGYMAEFVRLRGEDRTNHIASMTLNLSL